MLRIGWQMKGKIQESHCTSDPFTCLTTGKSWMRCPKLGSFPVCRTCDPVTFRSLFVQELIGHAKTNKTPSLAGNLTRSRMSGAPVVSLFRLQRCLLRKTQLTKQTYYVSAVIMFLLSARRWHSSCWKKRSTPFQRTFAWGGQFFDTEHDVLLTV